jgi:hypothetical protein
MLRILGAIALLMIGGEFPAVAGWREAPCGHPLGREPKHSS